MLQKFGTRVTEFDDGCKCEEKEFDAPTEKMTTPMPFFYQSGYLTIKQYNADKGRIDMVFQTATDLYVMELKIDRPASEALAQIDQKGYLLPYTNEGLRLHKVGISFSTEERTLSEWEIVDA